jgi:hypothetical protein
MTFDDLPQTLRETVLHFLDKIGRRGSVTYSELDCAIAKTEVSADEIDAILNFLMERGVDVVE